MSSLSLLCSTMNSKYAYNLLALIKNYLILHAGLRMKIDMLVTFELRGSSFYHRLN